MKKKNITINTACPECHYRYATISYYSPMHSFLFCEKCLLCRETIDNYLSERNAQILKQETDVPTN